MELQFEKLIEKGSFVLLCGKTGSGKTTLLKKWKKELGNRAMLVMQNPDNQIVMDKVYSELAFGLAQGSNNENLIRRRVAETAGFFGLSPFLGRDTDSLSGGEKQILNLASVMALDPEIILLDEPTAMLDPIMATRLIESIKKINTDFGKTIVITEHRPENLFAIADKVLLIDAGEIIVNENSHRAAKMFKEKNFEMLLPSCTRIFDREEELPLTVKECMKYVRKGMINKEHINNTGTTVLKIKDIFFAYDKKQKPVLKDFNMELKTSEITALVGENGSGKSTAAKLIAGILRPYAGKIKCTGKVGVLSQDVTDHFTEDTYEGKNPYDLSGGEMQQLALSLVLNNNPDILILDEPTKGLDNYEKQKLKDKLKSEMQGKTILIITHDLEFVAEICDRICMLHDGSLVFNGSVEEFFRDNIFYTTEAYRIFKEVSDNVITVEDGRKFLC